METQIEKSPLKPLTQWVMDTFKSNQFLMDQTFNVSCYSERDKDIAVKAINSTQMGTIYPNYRAELITETTHSGYTNAGNSLRVVRL